jgi:hypothetical protein
MLVTAQDLRAYASHCQFYVNDEEPKGDTGAKSFWSDEALADLVAVDDDIIGIGTALYGEVRVRVEIHDTEPVVVGDWDHITEAALSVRRGVIQITEVGVDERARFNVEPGRYRVRCCHANRAGAVIQAGPGDDWYLVQIWPGDGLVRTVLKRALDSRG